MDSPILKDINYLCQLLYIALFRLDQSFPKISAVLAPNTANINIVETAL